jgi:predicted dehydrogenase
LGWRQVAKLAGSGELGDMLSHRIDYAQMLIGPIEQVVADTRLFHGQRDGLISDLEDWVGILARFESTSTTGILESSKLATGRGEGAHSQDFVELNGEEGSVVFQLEDPLQLRLAKRGGRQLETIPVPKEFLKVPGSRRDPAKGDPLFSFRYDQTHIFIEAITNQQACEPSFRDGARAQAVMEAAIKSVEEGGWTAVAKV